MPEFGYVCDDPLLRPEHILLEELAPRRPHRGRQRPKIQYGVGEAVEPGSAPDFGSLDAVPPIVDQKVERLERLDVMPPKSRDEDRVPGIQLGGHGGGQARARNLGKRSKSGSCSETRLIGAPVGAKSSGPM